MDEEKKEIESSDDNPELKGEEQDKKEEETQKDDFEKEKEVVSAGKYNQAVRKQREIELEKRELERKLSEMESSKPEEKEEEDIFKEETPDTSKIIDEKLKPVLETIKKREESDKKIQRAAFFEAHPEYEGSAEKWQGLLEEMDRSINPNSPDDHYTQLEKAHRILTGESYNPEVEDKKKEMASDATSGGDGAEKTTVKEEFTAEERKYQKEFKVSEEGMRAYKEKIKSGSMRILS